MVILDDKVYQTLSPICPTYLGYVREWQELPYVSYICTSNDVARKLNNVEWTTHHVYKIDLYCHDEDDYVDFATKVDDAMSSLGFKRQSMTLLREETTHLVFYYTVYLDKDGFAWDSI